MDRGGRTYLRVESVRTATARARDFYATSVALVGPDLEPGDRRPQPGRAGRLRGAGREPRERRLRGPGDPDASRARRRSAGRWAWWRRRRPSTGSWAPTSRCWPRSAPRPAAREVETPAGGLGPRPPDDEPVHRPVAVAAGPGAAAVAARHRAAARVARPARARRRPALGRRTGCAGGGSRRGPSRSRGCSRPGIGPARRAPGRRSCARSAEPGVGSDGRVTATSQPRPRRRRRGAGPRAGRPLRRAPAAPARVAGRRRLRRRPNPGSPPRPRRRPAGRRGHPRAPPRGEAPLAGLTDRAGGAREAPVLASRRWHRHPSGVRAPAPPCTASPSRWPSLVLAAPASRPAAPSTSPRSPRRRPTSRAWPAASTPPRSRCATGSRATPAAPTPTSSRPPSASWPAALDQAEPVKVYLYIFRNRAAFDRHRDQIGPCAPAFVTDPDDVRGGRAVAVRRRGPGPWAPGFEAAVQQVLEKAAGTGG